MTRLAPATRPLTVCTALLAAVLLAAVLLGATACSAPAPNGDADAEMPAGAAEPAPPSSGAGERPPAPGPIVTCTQIGCSDGLAVEIDGFSEEVRIELAADGETRTLTCQPPGPCSHFVPDFMPEQVTMTAVLAGREEERAFTPEYRDERPNGPDCPPVCRQAKVRWDL